VDDDDTVVNGIKKGTISFTYVQQFYGNGYLQVYIPWLIVNKGLKPATKFLPTPIVLVDKANIDSYKDVVIKDFDKLKKYVDTEYMKK
jgi:ABC-type sugar transport system substrate-binding protein